MAYDNVKCFGCQNYGHIERDCPEKNYAAELGDDKPPWCGREICDRETRLIYFLRGGVRCSRRCHCHPSGHLLPVQFKRCKPCKSAIYAWDTKTECGSHLPVGADFAAKARAKYEAEKAAKAEAERRGKAAPERKAG